MSVCLCVRLPFLCLVQFSNLLLALTQVLWKQHVFLFEGYIPYNLISLSKNKTILSQEGLYEIIVPLKYSQEPLTVMTVLLRAFSLLFCACCFLEQD